MDKLSIEREILDFAKPVLEDIYGNFDVDPEQTDRPDAAIVLESNGTIIGIEITSVDDEEIQRYFNDEKHGRDLKSKQVEELVSTGKYSDRPDKKASITFPYSYIFDGVKKKAEKHADYMGSGRYEEVILIAFSDNLEIRSEHFHSYHKPWTWYLLSEVSFPFSKVIFVCRQHGDSTIVFDNSLPPPEPPNRDELKELGITRISGPTLPIGKEINLNKIFDNEPLITPKKKGKSKNKKKNKEQKKARKINRN